MVVLAWSSDIPFPVGVASKWKKYFSRCNFSYKIDISSYNKAISIIPTANHMFSGTPDSSNILPRHDREAMSRNPRWRPRNRRCLYLRNGMRYQRDPKGYPHVLGVHQLNRQLSTSVPADRHPKSKMAAYKPDVVISQEWNEISTRFQRLSPCFRGTPTQQAHRLHRHLPTDTRNPRWQPINRM